MVKKFAFALASCAILASCAALPPPASNIYLESLPQSVTAELTLEERIAAEEAWSYLEAGRAEKAAKGLLKLGPESPVYAIGLGYAYLILNDLPSSEASFKAALEARPEMALARLGLAQIYEREGREDLLFTQYQEILKTEPEHSWVKPRFMALREKKTEELLSEARTFFEAGDPAAGKKALLMAVFYSPESVEAHLELADAYRKEKNLSSAILHLKAATEIRPEDMDILKKYAGLLFEADELGRSLEVYERLAETSPRDKEITGRIDTLRNKLGIYEIPSLYDSIPAAAVVTREDVAALVAVKFKEALGSEEVKPPIIVDVSASWASRFILRTTALGILEVYDNHTFLPKKPITRADLADVLFRLINALKARRYKLIPQIPPDRIRISDVSPDSFSYQAVTQAVAYQVMELFPQQTFQPEAAVSGQEAVRAFDILAGLIK